MPRYPVANTRALLALALALLALTPPAPAVEQYSYRVLDRKPQERRLWVQGLEIHDGQLYVSGGLRGQSSLERYQFDSMQQEIARPVDRRLFAEGLTVLGDRVYQLTWTSGIVLVYDRESLQGREFFRLSGQGWGLTNDGEHLIYSNGSDQLHFLSPETRQVVRAVQVTERGRPLRMLNELEWIDGEIWANVWQTDRIVVIDPATGEVRASIDLGGLLPSVERLPGTSVLNGIARNPEDGAVWVTGKRWPWLYRIQLVPLTDTQNDANSR